MAIRKESEEAWASRVAGRLRIVYSSCADLEIDERRRFIDEELDYAAEDLAVLPSEQKQRYLKRLRERFPVWNPEGDEEVDALEITSRKRPDNAGERSPREIADEAVETLLRIRSELGEQDQRDIAKRLKLSELSEHPRSSSVDEVPAASREPFWDSEFEFPESSSDREQLKTMIATIRGDLKSHSGKIDFLRFIKLFRRSVLTILELDDIAREAWREISPDDTRLLARKSGTPDLEVLLSGYLMKDGAFDSSTMLDSLNITKTILVAFIFALGEGGGRFIRNFHRKFHPDQIRDYVRHEGTRRGLKKEEVLCWSRYEQLMDHSTEAILEGELRVEIKEIVAHALRQYHPKI